MMKYRWLKHFYVSSWLIFRYDSLRFPFVLIRFGLGAFTLNRSCHWSERSFYHFRIFLLRRVTGKTVDWGLREQFFFFNQSMNRWQNSLDFQTLCKRFVILKLTMVFSRQRDSLALSYLIWFNQIERNMLTNSGQFTFISIICYLLAVPFQCTRAIVAAFFSLVNNEGNSTIAYRYKRQNSCVVHVRNLRLLVRPQFNWIFGRKKILILSFRVCETIETSVCAQ